MPSHNPEYHPKKEKNYTHSSVTTIFLQCSYLHLKSVFSPQSDNVRYSFQMLCLLKGEDLGYLQKYSNLTTSHYKNMGKTCPKKLGCKENVLRKLTHHLKMLSVLKDKIGFIALACHHAARSNFYKDHSIGSEPSIPFHHCSSTNIQIFLHQYSRS